jgi:hypothetical protein
MKSCERFRFFKISLTSFSSISFEINAMILPVNLKAKFLSSKILLFFLIKISLFICKTLKSYILHTPLAFEKIL